MDTGFAARFSSESVWRSMWNGELAERRTGKWIEM